MSTTDPGTDRQHAVRQLAELLALLSADEPDLAAAAALGSKLQDDPPSSCTDRGAPSLESPSLPLALATLSMATAGVVRWRLVKEWVLFPLEERLHPRKDTPPGKRETLPLLIAARDEGPIIRRTLAMMLAEAERFEKTHPEVRIQLIVCDNASTDNTSDEVLRFAREHSADLGVEREEGPARRQSAAATEKRVTERLVLLHEPKAGKKHALCRLIRYVEESGCPGRRAVFADADVLWEEGLLDRLWMRLDRDPDIHVAGANWQPLLQEGRPPTLWGLLDRAAFHGYGGTERNGRGKFMGFAAGGTWMAADRTRSFANVRLASSLGTDDGGNSILTGAQHIAVVPDAVLRHPLPRTWSDFKRVRGRHLKMVRGNLDSTREREYAALLFQRPDLDPRRSQGLRRLWIARRGRAMAHSTADPKVFSVLEFRTGQIVRGFITSDRPLRFNARALREYVADIPICNMSFRELFAVGILMLPLYTWLKLEALWLALRGRGTEEWDPVRTRRS